MNKVTLISVDLAKDVFQVAGFTDRLKEVFNRQIKRGDLTRFLVQQPTCEVVMEACYSSHYWGRVFRDMGHRVRLLPAQHVKPFVRGNKSDHNDAVAIAEASRRPKINEVPIKTVAQQEIQSLQSEYGVVCPKGHKSFLKLIGEISDPESIVLSASIKIQYRLIAEEYHQLTARITGINEQLRQIVVEQPECQLLSSIPGIGVINATAIYSAIGGGNQFKNAREFAVWLGLTPRQSSSGNSFSSGGITKRGDRYLRKQLVHGARALLCSCRNKTDRLSMWANALVARRGYNKACVGLAARLARLCWILLQKKEVYEAK